MTKTNTLTPSSPTNASPKINEAFLHYVWKTKNYKFQHLTSTQGKPIKLIHPGLHNHDAGPDFLDGKIEYDGVAWAGHIELHVLSSDWYRHHHQVDPAYDQVILHVVWEDDRPVTDIHLVPIITLELKGLVDLSLLSRTEQLIHSRYRIPCSYFIGQLSPFWLNAWKERQLIERLEYRLSKIHHRFAEVKGDWEQVAFECLSRSMGFHANSDPLEALAQDISWKQVRKVIHDEKALQALLFGRAGWLTADFDEMYPMALKTEYDYLKSKYKLSSQVFIKWNFKGARPPNFPTIRLAQLAAILYQKHSLIRALIDADTIEELASHFSIELPDFWQTHYVLTKSVDKTKIKLSTASIRLLLINYCIPLLYAYGERRHRDDLKEKAIQLLYQLPAEKNAIIKEFHNAGATARCAAESQALLHTYREYCAAKRCLDCQVGSKLISGGK